MACIKKENTNLAQNPVLKCVYTVDEIRQMLGIGKNEAYRLTQRDSFPAIRIGNRIVIPKEAFHQWLNGSS